MPEHRQPLTVYRIRDSIGGAVVKSFSDALDPDAGLTVHEVQAQIPLDAQLFVVPATARTPEWVDFVTPAFGELEEVLDSAANGAVLVIRIQLRRRPLYFAICFGQGRHHLRPNVYVRSYGLRTALNTIYQGLPDRAQLEPARVRAIDTKTVAANTVHTRRQADRTAAFEAFGTDIQRDLLRAVTGQPVDVQRWGNRVAGADALYLNIKLNVEELPELCRQIEQAFRRDDYAARFSWIDNIKLVGDRDLVGTLENLVLSKLMTHDIDGLSLAPPELVRWDELRSFRFSFDIAAEKAELELTEYLEILEQRGKLTELTLRLLQHGHRIASLDGDGQPVRNWPVFNCLAGELSYRDRTYLISDGDFYEVAEGYRQELDTDLHSLQESPIELPPSGPRTHERQYNSQVARLHPDYILLDRKTVRLSTRTTPIEVCDLLSPNGHFIHVKRDLGSSTLSHLFEQGYVSAELLQGDREFREAVLRKITASQGRPRQRSRPRGGHSPFRGLTPEGLRTSDYEVVYAIIARWNERGLLQALPLFSKITLRRHVKDLTRMGYRVSYKRIPIH